MVRVLMWLVAGICFLRAQAITPDLLLTNLHAEAQGRPAHDRLDLLYDLAIAATGMNPQTSVAWSLEMFELAADAPQESNWQEVHRAAGRKNALTILSLTDPVRAAQYFPELKPSAGHQPNEDPRIDLARNLFPRLWAKRGKESLPTILGLADFTSRSGQYPYIAIGHILPKLAKLDRAAAHSLLLTAVHRRGEERGIWRTADDYVKFLRESWPALSTEDREVAVTAAVSVVQRDVEDKAASAPGSRTYVEYYLPQGTARFDSEETARVYDLLPFLDDINAALGQHLRHQYPDLANVPIPPVDVKPWRSAVFAAAGHDTPERVAAAFERHHLLFLRQWANEDANRAMALAQATKDPGRRRAATALVLPAYSKINPAQADAWRRELMGSVESARTSDDLAFLVALARTDFALGHADAGEEVTQAALKLGEQFLGTRDLNLPVYMAEGAAELHDLAMTYGEFRSNNLARYVGQCDQQDSGVRLFLLAGLTRGAMRNRPGYQEPN